jgi:hypothetical protein
MMNPFDDLRGYARHLADEVPGEMTRLRVERALDATPRPRKTLVAIAAAILLTTSNVALAAVADPSSPGDGLYRIDRLYERIVDLVGESNRSVERLDEAAVMLERGRASEALALVREALTDSEGAADIDRARQLISGVGAGSDTAAFDEAVKLLVEVARLVSVSDDRQAAAHQISESAKNVAEAAKALQDNAPAGKPDDPGSQGNRP